MRLTLSLLSALGIATGVVAQNNNSLYNYASDNTQNATSFTDRHGIAGAEEGYIYKIFRNFCAIGNDFDDSTLQATAGELAGYAVVIQDQVGATPETYEVGVYTDDPTNPGNPPCPPTPGTTLATSGRIPTPASTSTGVVAWIVTFTATTPQNVLPTTGNVYLGIYCSPAPTYPADGFSVQGAWYPAGTTGENPHSGAPNYTATCNITQNNLLVNPGNGSDNRNVHGAILTTRPVFEVGADIDPAFDRNGASGFDYGVAGHYPDTIIRGDGMCFRITDANSEGMPAGVLGGIGALPANPLNGGALGLYGWFCLDLAGLLPVTFAQGVITGGVVEQCPFPFGNSLPLPQGAVVHFQGVILDIAQARALLTNGVQMQQL